MAAQKLQEAQNPLLLRAARLMEAFAKSDDERDFYLDRQEGFIIFADLNKSADELQALEAEIAKISERYCMIPKLTFYETKKIMEGFVNEKVYDIDTKEKLLDIIQSKEARENFLEFIYDNHTELEKWQQYYQERSRIRIIEWLRNNHFHFVFEEDLEIAVSIIEKVKESLFEDKAIKEVLSARKAILTKARSYYSNEALNPRPKRGRPPKQTQKLEIEPQVSKDIYLTVSSPVRPFLFTPDITTASDITFSAKFESGEELIASLKTTTNHESDFDMKSLSKKLEDLRHLSASWMKQEDGNGPSLNFSESESPEINMSDLLSKHQEKKPTVAKVKKEPSPKKKAAPAKTVKKAEPKRIMPKEDKKKKTPAKKTVSKAKAPVKKEPAKKKKLLRRTNKTK